MLYKDLCIFFGPYIDVYPIYAKFENPTYSYDDSSSFTFPNVGFNFGVGFFVYKSKGFKLYTGFNLKYQFITFTRNVQEGSKILALLIDVSFLF
jgi:hypothetical protein